MKLSISNIAWPVKEEESYLNLIKKLGCSGVEIAPSRLWPKPIKASQEDCYSYKSLVKKCGLEISAMQALLYTRRDLGLFRDPEIETETVKYLKELCRLAADLETQVLVFGSPANRKRGDIPLDEAFERAASFFSKVAPTAEKLGVRICIEPLRPQETDFITTAEEGFRLVEMVNSAGFGLHLDAKALAEEGDKHLHIFKNVLQQLRHFHINDPNLTEINSTGFVDHLSMGKAIRNAGYNRYVSVEMRTLPDYHNVIRRSLQIAREAYLDSKS